MVNVTLKLIQAHPKIRMRALQQVKKQSTNNEEICFAFSVWNNTNSCLYGCFYCSVPEMSSSFQTHRLTQRTATILDRLRVFKPFSWLEVGPVKIALSRPGRAPGWCPIPPRRIEPVEITRG